jgi:hypothetical protein
MPKTTTQLVRCDETVTLACRVPVDTAARLQDVAADRQASVSSLIAGLVERFIDTAGEA